MKIEVWAGKLGTLRNDCNRKLVYFLQMLDSARGFVRENAKLSARSDWSWRLFKKLILLICICIDPGDEEFRRARFGNVGSF
jgi:hypothetical protein